MIPLPVRVLAWYGHVVVDRLHAAATAACASRLRLDREWDDENFAITWRPHDRIVPTPEQQLSWDRAMYAASITSNRNRAALNAVNDVAREAHDVLAQWDGSRK